MKKAFERLMEYSLFATPSNEANDTCPSSDCQLAFAGKLVEEMHKIGISDAFVDAHGYVYGTIPANTDCDIVIGFIAHMDVISDVPCEDPVFNLFENYDGKDLILNSEKNIVMSPDEYPSMKRYIGKTLLTTDGTTILGADDKAGVAEIMTMAEYLISHPEIKHGTIKIGFTPDEEIGRGADLFDVEGFGADFAYTVDGAAFGEVDFETFNAFSAKVSVDGVSIHPGSAKNKMINAIDAAHEFHAILPAAMKPRHTEAYEGFIHLHSISGGVEHAELHYIVRDHDYSKALEKIEIMKKAAEVINQNYGRKTVSIEIKESYRNMEEKIRENMHLIENAYRAIEALGGKPVSSPVRGGTDGARLSFMGLPCPNLGTGSHNHHGRFEYACCEDMEKCAILLVEIAKLYAQN